MKIILTSTGGNLGSRVLHNILNHNLIPTSDLIISTSSPHKVAALAKQNEITLVPGDYTDPESLNSSYRDSGADILFLISYPSPSIERWLQHKTAIDAAKQSGSIRLIVYTSLMFGGKDGMHSVAGVQQAHIRTVEYLRNSGMEHVVLREGIYAESWWLYAGYQPHPIPKDGPAEIDFVIPSDGEIAWVSWDDLGEGTARILAELVKGQREYIGQTLNLTGPRATSLSEIARLVEKVSGRKVNLKLVGKEAAKEYHLKDGKKEKWQVESWVGWFDGVSAGECAVVDPLLEEILGRAPLSVEECAEELFTPQ